MLPGFYHSVEFLRSETSTMKALAATALAMLLAFGNVQPALGHVRWNNNKSQRRHIARRGKARVGANYCWGGTSGCYDCSGFTYAVFNGHGAELPHSSSGQWDTRHRSGYRTVWQRGELRKGDLVFFANTYKSGVSHVGIYLGDSRFVHGSSEGGVQVDSLRDDYYSRHYKAAVRPKSLRASGFRD